MLKRNNKVLFYFLLTPFYLNMMIILFFGLLAGLAIMWKETIIYNIINFAGAWLISLRKNIWLNILGFLGFLYYGWYYISYIFNTPIIGPWQINLYAGIFIISLGFLGLVYDIIALIISSKSS